jgi:hypothetical protein
MEYVAVDKETLERILAYLGKYDDQEDYRGDMWKSQQLKNDINHLIDLIGLPKNRKL